MVDWEDTAKYGNAYTELAAKRECNPKLITSVGILIEQTDEKILMAAEVSLTENKFRDLLSIPACNVKKITQLVVSE